MKNREIRITKENDIFQHMIVLKTNRNKRHKAHEFIVEGVDNINLAVKKGWKINHWIYDNFANLSNWAKDKICKVKTEIDYSFSSELMTKISGKIDTSELMCVVEMQEQKVNLSENPKILLLDRPSKHGNLGSIIRSAEAFGFDGIIITGHAVDHYAPEVVTSSMGSIFSIPVEIITKNEEILAKISELREKYKDFQVVASLLDGAIEINKVNFKKPTLLLMGNEGEGLNNFYREICDIKTKIPMQGDVDSFNIACATSVFMYEINRQRS